jgi:16S rRNA (cytidine1402-2'-O)-methyltransferase
MGTLYLIATPIGNLEDITVRASRLLGEVSLVAAEDTRRTGKLLAYLGIKTRLVSYFQHNELKQLDSILETLDGGDIALVSDAGTPAINDPGFLLVREALKAGHQVSPVPGPSAPIAALVVSGLASDRFTYLGYLPRKGIERRRFLQEVKDWPYTLIFLEAPHRLESALQDIYTVLGDRTLAVARELTKVHEEVIRGTVSEAITHFRQAPPRGEITIVVSGAAPESSPWPPERVERAIKEHLSRGEKVADIARTLAVESNWPRRDLYDLVTELKERSGPHNPG